MINLIPNEEKKKMLKDFYFRLLTLFFMMLSVSFLVSSVAILPSYILSVVEEGIIKTKLQTEAIEIIPISDQDTLQIVQDLKYKLSLIENIQKNKTTFSKEIINEILLKKSPNIKITRISYKDDLKTGKKIDIEGLAPNREVLLLFRRALEDSTVFSKVDLPISNFIKGSNIKFHLSLIPS